MAIKVWCLILLSTSWCLIPAAFLAIVQTGAFFLSGIIVALIAIGGMRLLATSPTGLSEQDGQGMFVGGAIGLGALFALLTWIIAGVIAAIGVMCCIAFSLAVTHLVRLAVVCFYELFWPPLERHTSEWPTILSVIVTIISIVWGLITFDRTSFDQFNAAIESRPIFKLLEISTLGPVADAAQAWVADSVRSLWLELLPRSLGIGSVAALVHVGVEIFREQA